LRFGAIKRATFSRIDDISPILKTTIPKGELTKSGKKKRVAISIFPSGTINIVGVTSMAEAEKFYETMTKEMRRILG